MKMMPTSSSTYTLYLDEINPNDPFKYFCLAGILVRDDIYKEQIIPEVNNLKNKVFGTTDIILHEIEAHSAKYGTPYYIFRKNPEKKREYWDGVRQLFSDSDFKVLAVAVEEAEINRLYPSKKDRYFIALQVILENYVHFLMHHGPEAKGSIVIESRNPGQDSKLSILFRDLIKIGTLFFYNVHLQDHLTTISFPKKEENIIGLQIADMIPNPLNRYLSEVNQKEATGNLIEMILEKAYDGFVGKRDRFGIKVIPSKKERESMGKVISRESKELNRVNL